MLAIQKKPAIILRPLNSDRVLGGTNQHEIQLKLPRAQADPPYVSANAANTAPPDTIRPNAGIPAVEYLIAEQASAPETTTPAGGGASADDGDPNTFSAAALVSCEKSLPRAGAPRNPETRTMLLLLEDNARKIRLIEQTIESKQQKCKRLQNELEQTLHSIRSDQARILCIRQVADAGFNDIHMSDRVGVPDLQSILSGKPVNMHPAVALNTAYEASIDPGSNPRTATISFDEPVAGVNLHVINAATLTARDIYGVPSGVHLTVVEPHKGSPSNVHPVPTVEGFDSVAMFCIQQRASILSRLRKYAENFSDTDSGKLWAGLLAQAHPNIVKGDTRALRNRFPKLARPDDSDRKLIMAILPVLLAGLSGGSVYATGARNGSGGVQVDIDDQSLKVGVDTVHDAAVEELARALGPSRS